MPQKDKVKHKRRYCRVPDCGKIVKSQGLCQRHGAKTRKCKVVGCEKQAQGNFDGMCKLHFKITKTQLIAKPPPPEEMQLGPVGESVYDRILPESIGWMDVTEAMPLVRHLKDGFDRQKPRGWHRNEERRARGLVPVTNPAIQLEGWERELVWMEICLLSGCPQSSFRHLARSWGRDKGFHMVLAQFICERRGNVERKKRVKGDSLTKKSRRAPVELAPSGEELPNSASNAALEELDDVDLEMLGVLEGVEDPTVNFTHIPDFSSWGKRNKRRQPIEITNAGMPPDDYHMSPGQQQQQQQQLPTQLQQQQQQIQQQLQRVPPPLATQHPYLSIHAGPHHPIQQQLHQTHQQQQQHHHHVMGGMMQQMIPQSITPVPAATMMGGGKILTHEALICEESLPHQQQQHHHEQHHHEQRHHEEHHHEEHHHEQQQSGMYDASVPV